MEIAVQFLMEQWIIVLIAVVSGSMLLVPLLSQSKARDHLSTLQATQLINQRSAVIIDVRDQAEYAAGHIVGARHIPHKTIATRRSEIEKVGKHPVLISDQTGQHAVAVATEIRSLGITEVFILNGGVQAWRNAGLPLVKK